MNRRGILYAVLSSLLFGASTPLAKALLGGIDPWLLAGILYCGSGVGLSAVMVARRLVGVDAALPMARADLGWLALATLFGGVLGPVLLMQGLARTSAAAGSLLLNLEGLATMGIAWLVFGENVDRRLLLGALLILAGSVAVSWPGALGGVPEVSAGAASCIAGACLAWGIDNNLTRKISAGDPLRIAAVKGAVAGALNLSIAFGQGASLSPPGWVLAAGVTGFAGYGLSLCLFVLSLRHLGAARTGAYFATAPFVGAILSVPLLHEAVSPSLAVAGALMAAGVWLHLAERHEHEHTHEPLRHAHRHVHDEHHQHAHHEGDPAGEPHEHEHQHDPLTHRHPHYPDLHHRHRHA